jgi:hypothetical protein
MIVRGDGQEVGAHRNGSSATKGAEMNALRAGSYRSTGVANGEDGSQAAGTRLRAKLGAYGVLTGIGGEQIAIVGRP